MRQESSGAGWERASGTAFVGAVKYTLVMNIPPILFGKVTVGYIRQQCRFVAMVVLFPTLWSESDPVSWKWNERR